MDTPNTVVIIGAGVMGLGLGWRLAQAGCSVRVLERAHPGAGASRAAAGMLAPIAEMEFDETPLLEFGMASQNRWPSFVQELEDAAGQSIEYETTGTLMVAWDRDEEEALERQMAYQQKMGMQVQWLSGRALRRREAMLSPRIVGGILCAHDVQVSNRCLVDALCAAAKSSGVRVETGVEVQSLIFEDGAVCGVRTQAQSEIRADMTVVAAGAWSASFALENAFHLPVRPVKGQMLALQMDGEHPIVRHVIRRPLEGIYLVPKRDGSLVIGGTVEEMGFDTSITARGLRRILDGAFEIVPGVDELPLKETWVGFRPASHDGEPILGRTKTPGLSVMTGHYRHGIQMSPLSIDAVSASILDGELPAIARSFEPGRLARPSGG